MQLVFRICLKIPRIVNQEAGASKMYRTTLRIVTKTVLSGMLIIYLRNHLMFSRIPCPRRQLSLLIPNKLLTLLVSCKSVQFLLVSQFTRP